MSPAVSLIVSLAVLLTESLTLSLTSFIHCFTRRLTHCVTHHLTRSVTHRLTRCVTQAVKDSKTRRLPSSMPDELVIDETSGELREIGAEGNYDRWVPANMYHFLEEEMRILRVDAEEKAAMLMERDELTEALERKVDVLTRAKAAESNRRSREIARLNTELEEARASFTKTASKASTMRRSGAISSRKGAR